MRKRQEVPPELRRSVEQYRKVRRALRLAYWRQVLEGVITLAALVALVALVVYQLRHGGGR